MQIINILELVNGIPKSIKSFPILDEQFTNSVVKNVEDVFIKEINKTIHPNILTDEDKEYILDEGSYDNRNGYEIYIIWSDL